MNLLINLIKKSGFKFNELIFFMFFKIYFTFFFFCIKIK